MFALNVLSHPYPQRQETIEPSWLDRLSERVRVSLRARLRLSRFQLGSLVTRVEAEERVWEGLSVEGAAQAKRNLRIALRRHGFADVQVTARALALLRRTAKDTLGLYAYPAQLKGAYVLLYGQVAEMNTGEGKTLTAALAAGCAALAGLKVHVVTVNDYLARRDAEMLAGFFKALGLSVASLLESMQVGEKSTAYRCDVVYGANKIIVFDYLRDRIALGERMRPISMSLDALAESNPSSVMLPGLQFAIVDEADSVFIDEARTPLIISVENRDAEMESYHRQAIVLAKQLLEGEDFELTAQGHRPLLTRGGRMHLAELAADLDGIWRGERRREEAVIQALVALHGFHRDIDYIIRDGKVMIVDENTGRVMPDRSWELGLQQLIEIKEGLELSPAKETLARLSYQAFFRRYLNLSGMTGTCREVAGELGSVYGLGVVRIAPHRPLRRRRSRTRIFATADTRWRVVAEAVARRHAAGQPVLVGTRSILASECLSACLLAAGVPHQVLNAKQDAEEATVIASAGQAGQVTIATNMAGRGTDIKLGTGVVELGGLHVILTEGHDNQRVDRQLAGRCARQGDPGSWESILSLEDELPRQLPCWLLRRLSAWLSFDADSRLAQVVAIACYRVIQGIVSWHHGRIRQQLLLADDQARRALSFSGASE